MIKSLPLTLGVDNSLSQVTNKELTLLAVYGEGGHRREMTQLLSYLAKQPIAVVSIGPQTLDLPQNCRSVAHFKVKDIRHKDKRWRTFIALIPVLLVLMAQSLLVWRKFSLAGVVSTGPGLSIIPLLFLRLVGVKTIFVETYCRFNTRSLTGRVMSKIAHRFLVQNKDQLMLYPDAEYCGRL